MSLFGYSAIQAMLTHRYSNRPSDAVLSLEPRHSIVAIKCVTGNEPCYAALPNGPTRRQMAYPVSLIVESFSQAGVILWMRSVPTQGTGGVLMFGVAKDCVFERDVFPGDTMQHCVTLERAIADALIFSGETWVGNQRIARFGWLVAVTRTAEALAR